MYVLNNLRIMQNQEIKDNRSLIVIRSHISPDIYEVFGLPYHDFRSDMLTLHSCAFDSSLTLTPAYKNQHFHNHLINTSHSSMHPKQVIANYCFPISIMQFLFID